MNDVKDRLLHTVDRLSMVRLLVLGDIVADEYIFGQPTRLSREAPIPVLEYRGRQIRPGGGTNPAMNARALGATVHVAGIIGNDEMGETLRSQLADVGIDPSGLVTVDGRRTYTKTRIVAGDTQVFHQQVARIDRVDYQPVGADVNDKLWAFLSDCLKDVDALLIADYEAGVINATILERCLPCARKLGTMICVDAHAELFRFRGVTVATPNQPEASLSVGYPINDAASLERAGRALVDTMDAEAVLITRGSDGMALFERDMPTSTMPSAVFGQMRDPTGAGDTVAAVFAMARIAAASYLDAALLANLAAGVVVSRLGVATCSPDDLREAIVTWQPTTVSE